MKIRLKALAYLDEVRSDQREEAAPHGDEHVVIYILIGGTRIDDRYMVACNDFVDLVILGRAL